MKRRNFLQALLALLGSISFASFVYPLVRFLAPPSAEAKARKVTLQKNEVPVGGAKNIVVNNSPAIVINRAGKGFIAFSKVCTHLGCLVEYDKDNNRLVCPCHAGIYDLEGNVLSGPPPKPLPKLPLRVEGDNIVIG
ncbi:MAG TPA: ubiquinol-cytochrome c reductase iron-sulfur subunit [Thermodesulfovibrionales bacterium]|nr:ubiquinol-cytochrome c reductase iron-sulfur subunit [Thermodesulfovibrionales bacterium]